MVDSFKVMTIFKSSPPCIVHQLQSLQGKENFLQGFITYYAEITNGLMCLSKKGVTFIWDGQAQRSFEAFQKALMSDEESLEAGLNALMELDEDRFIAGLNQTINKRRQKAWHDINLRSKTLEPGKLALWYDSKFFHNLGKFKIRWLGPFRILDITEFGAVKLTQLYGRPMKGLVNGSRLKPYFGPDGSH
jgi:hypothetical protein